MHVHICSKDKEKESISLRVGESHGRGLEGAKGGASDTILFSLKMYKKLTNIKNKSKNKTKKNIVLCPRSRGNYRLSLQAAGYQPHL